MDFIINNWYLFVALVLVLALLFGPVISQLMHGIKSVNTAQAVNLINHSKGIVVDVCEPKEFQTGHIPDSVNMPLSHLAAHASELDKHKNAPIIVSCRSGQRSVKGAVILRKHGFDSVYTLSGGMLAWQRENLPVEK